MSKNSSRNASPWLITSRSTGRFNAPPLHVDAARPCRHRVGDRWFVDETYAKVASIWLYVSPVVDQHGQVIDVYVSKRRDIASPTTFFTTMLHAHSRPQDVTADLAAPIWLHRSGCTNTTVPPEVPVRIDQRILRLLFDQLHVRSGPRSPMRSSRKQHHRVDLFDVLIERV